MGYTVLVVDDQQDNIDLMSEMLEDNDMVAFAADNGQEAFEIACREQPDVIVLDVQMPGMNGYEVCDLLKKETATMNIPVIFLTATHNSEDNIVRGLDLGAYDYVTKPFREAELVARIKVMAKIKQTEDIVREESYTDPLTGLYNRRFLEKRFEEELSRARRWHASCSTLITSKALMICMGTKQGIMFLKMLRTSSEINCAPMTRFLVMAEKSLWCFFQ